LQTLLSRNADADVGRLDHRDVVGAVADGERHDAEVVLDEVDNLRLLQGRDATADDGVAARRQLKQKVLGPLLGESLVGCVVSATTLGSHQRRQRRTWVKAEPSMTSE
jgi:hypothetical protein